MADVVGENLKRFAFLLATRQVHSIVVTTIQVTVSITTDNGVAISTTLLFPSLLFPSCLNEEVIGEDDNLIAILRVRMDRASCRNILREVPTKVD